MLINGPSCRFWVIKMSLMASFGWVRLICTWWLSNFVMLFRIVMQKAAFLSSISEMSLSRPTSLKVMLRLSPCLRTASSEGVTTMLILWQNRNRGQVNFSQYFLRDLEVEEAKNWSQNQSQVRKCMGLAKYSIYLSMNCRNAQEEWSSAIQFSILVSISSFRYLDMLALQQILAPSETVSTTQLDNSFPESNELFLCDPTQYQLFQRGSMVTSRGTWSRLNKFFTICGEKLCFTAMTLSTQNMVSSTFLRVLLAVVMYCLASWWKKSGTTRTEYFKASERELVRVKRLCSPILLDSIRVTEIFSYWMSLGGLLSIMMVELVQSSVVVTTLTMTQVNRLASKTQRELMQQLMAKSWPQQDSVMLSLENGSQTSASPIHWFQNISVWLLKKTSTLEEFTMVLLILQGSENVETRLRYCTDFSNAEPILSTCGIRAIVPFSTLNFMVFSIFSSGVQMLRGVSPEVALWRGASPKVMMMKWPPFR